jgi:hypothetical protein
MEWEQADERPLLIQTQPFWADETERMTYEDACSADKPKDEDSLLSYLARISATVEGKYRGVLPKMRRPGLSQSARELRLKLLRAQGQPSKVEVL